MGFRRVAVLLIMFGVMCQAQDNGPSDRETIQQLVQQVKELQKEVAELKAQRSAEQNSTQTVTQNSATPQNEASQDPQPSLAQEIHDLRGIQWRGFGEADYKVLNQRKPELGSFGFVPGSTGDFFVGAFDLLLTSRISDKASVLSEIVFEEGDAQSFDVDLERLLLKYDYNDHLLISAGRYQTGIGYYNTAYHSGSWLQTAADRPLIIEFASHGGPLPTQAVGLSVTGEFGSEKAGLHYVAEYGSSDTIRPDLNGVSSTDENNGNHFNVGFFARPDALPGLQIGASFYHDQISDFSRGPSVRLGQTILNAHAVYFGHKLELLNEGFLIRHAYTQAPDVYNMPAFYTQISRKFGRARPFFRYQYMNANPNSIFSDISLRRGPSFGARYDLNDYIAFKAQLDHMLRKGQPDLDGLHLQLAFTF